MKTGIDKAIEAVARRLDPVAFQAIARNGPPEFREALPEFRNHMAALRRRARMNARLAVDELLDIGWKGPGQ